MARKKILIFIDWYLPGYKAGGPIQSVANMVAHFKNEYDISVVTRDTDYCETIPYPSVKSNEWILLQDGTRVYYFSQSGLNRTAIQKLIRQTEADTVYLNGVFSLYFTLFPLYYLRKYKAKNVVIASRGMLAESALGLKKTKKQFFVFAVKVLRLFENVVFHASSEHEKKDIYKILGKNTQVKIAGNLPQKISIEKLPQRKKGKGELRLINVARIAPEKNLLFALNILKEVKSAVLFDFYGPIYNNDYWEECKLVIANLPKNIQVNYKGSLDSQQVLIELQNYHFMFMPTRGENFGHIILQSLSVGCPVIISNQTPWKSLEADNVGWDIELSNNVKFSVTIEKSAKMNQDEFNLMSQSAYEYSKKYINNPEIIEQNRQLFIV